MAAHRIGVTTVARCPRRLSRRIRLKMSASPADDSHVMADVQFAPPLQRLASPPNVAPVPPPPPPVAALPPISVPAPRLSMPVPVVRDTSSVPAINFQDFLQPAKVDQRPTKKSTRRRGKKLISILLLLGIIGGAAYYFRNAPAVQRLLGHDQVAKLPAVPFVRPGITSAEYTITLSAVQNGVPNNVTTKVMEDFNVGLGQTSTENQIGGAFTTAQEIRTRESVFRPGEAFGATWTRQPRVPETPSPYDAVEYIPMIDDIIDQTMRTVVQPTRSKATKVDSVIMTSLTYVLDRAKVPEIAPVIFAKVPWLFDVPNATTLTVSVTYDETGLVRHLFFGVDPPQPGTGIDATWVTSYTLDVTSVNAPVSIPVPLDVVDVPAGTP